MSAVAGYSGTPLWRKLGLKSGQRFHVASAPANLDELLDGAPQTISRIRRLDDCDIALAFVTMCSELDRVRADALETVRDRGMLWIAWPKKSAHVQTELTEDVVRRAALPLGWVDVKVCAIGRGVSGLKLVRRRR